MRTLIFDELEAVAARRSRIQASTNSGMTFVKAVPESVRTRPGLETTACVNRPSTPALTVWIHRMRAPDSSHCDHLTIAEGAIDGLDLVEFVGARADVIVRNELRRRHYCTDFVCQLFKYRRGDQELSRNSLSIKLTVERAQACALDSQFRRAIP